jgi:hypothetical protein
LKLKRADLKQRQQALQQTYRNVRNRINGLVASSLHLSCDWGAYLTINRD